MASLEKTVERVRALIRLTASSEREEARTAAEHACRLIRENKLEIVAPDFARPAPPPPPPPAARPPPRDAGSIYESTYEVHFRGRPAPTDFRADFEAFVRAAYGPPPPRSKVQAKYPVTPVRPIRCAIDALRTDNELRYRSIYCGTCGDSVPVSTIESFDRMYRDCFIDAEGTLFHGDCLPPDMRP